MPRNNFRVAVMPARQPAYATGKAGARQFFGREPGLVLSYRLKTVLDVFFAVVALVVLSPLMGIIAVAICLESKGSPVFLQKRVGGGGQVFKIWKFRTMHICHSDCRGGAQATRRDVRCTRVGRFLRRTSLDELPQLINVLKGEMSVVGPRPHALEHHHYHARRIIGYEERLSVKPGLTGWAQVNGSRGATTDATMQRRVELDLEYIARWSLWFDLQIIALTLFWYHRHSLNAH